MTSKQPIPLPVPVEVIGALPRTEPMTNPLDELPINPETLTFGDLTHRQVVDLLAPYDDARADAKAAGERQKALGDAIRGFLEAHPEEIVRDGEHLLEAALQFRSTGEAYDVGAMPDGLILALAGHGCLKVDAKAVEALASSLSAASRAQEFRRPGGRIAALVVRAVRA